MSNVSLGELINYYSKQGVKAPSELAEEFWIRLQQALPEEDDWNLLCFCIEYLAMRVQQDSWLPLDIIKQLTRLLYIAHYTTVAPRQAGSRKKVEIHNESINGEGLPSNTLEHGDSGGNGTTETNEETSS